MDNYFQTFPETVLFDIIVCNNNMEIRNNKQKCIPSRQIHA